MGGFTKRIPKKAPQKKTADVIPREDWGAQNIKGPVVRLKHPVLFVRYGYTGTETCKVAFRCEPILREYQQKFIDNNYADQPFNFLISGNGVIYEGRGWQIEADRPDKIHKKIRGNAVDIGFIGDFSDEKPNDKMIEAGELLVDFGLEEKYIQQCPKILNLNDFQPLLADE